MAAKVYTLEELRAWTPERRRDLYINAKARPEGAYIVEMIDEHGLSLSSSALSSNDPLYHRMVEITWSKPGKEAAVAATKQGFPALCGVDRLLRDQLGDLYHKHNMGTFSAGGAVAEVMRHLGYREIGKGKCPDDCVARTGIVWG